MKISRLFIFISPLLYIGAMFLPGIVDDRGTMLGQEVLLSGWIGTFGLMFAWWANIFGIPAFIFAAFKMYKTAFVLSAVAFIIGLQSYAFTSYPRDESGSSDMIMVHHLGAGFYVWELSFLLISICCFFQIRKREILPALKQPKV